MKNLNNILKDALNKNFEELTEKELMIISLKGDLEKYKAEEEETEQKAFLGAFISETVEQLKNLGIEVF